MEIIFCNGDKELIDIWKYFKIMSSSAVTGDNSFGWSPIFIPEGYEKTYAELSTEEQAPVAMRNKALSKLRDFLSSLK